MSSRPLFISVAESMVIFGPIDQLGCVSASAGVAAAISSVRPVAERPARAGEDDALDVVDAPALEQLEDRVVLGIDRQDRRRRAARAAAMNSVAGGDQAFLVGERDARAGARSRQASGRDRRRRRSPPRPDRPAAPPPPRPPPLRRPPRCPVPASASLRRRRPHGSAIDREPRAGRRARSRQGAPRCRSAVTASTS